MSQLTTQPEMGGVEMDWDDRLQKEPYQGVLFVSREAIASLSGGGEFRRHITDRPAGARGPEILDAALDGEEIRIHWTDGTETRVGWRALQERGGLRHLRPPRLAFASDRDALGLLFTSRTPHEGLEFVEPHSPIAPVGWLTAEGFEEDCPPPC